MGKARQTESFELTGQFLGFNAVDGYKLQYLRLQADGEVYLVKIPKEQRLELYRTLKGGEYLRCTGEKKVKTKDPIPQVTYKAREISTFSQGRLETVTAKVKVLICNKSDCRRQGSGAIAQVCQELGALVQWTGCHKQCKQAPNLVIHSPYGKTRLSRASPEQVRQILQANLL
jgi:(2Fe-2S) ferredoxin